MSQNVTKIAVVLIVIIAFIDGILVANRFREKEETIEPETETVVLEDVFEGVTAEVEEEVEEYTGVVLHDVPYTPQAPHWDWKSPWDGFTEEAVAYMAVSWARGDSIDYADQAASDLLAIGRWEGTVFGHSGDTDIFQTHQIITDYFEYLTAYINYDVTLETLKQTIKNGNLIILPVNGQILDSPYYGNPAPEHHMLLLIGYDENTSEFIVHDPGTVRGEAYRFSFEKVLAAIQDLDGSQLSILISS